MRNNGRRAPVSLQKPGEPNLSSSARVAGDPKRRPPLSPPAPSTPDRHSCERLKSWTPPYDESERPVDSLRLRDESGPASDQGEGEEESDALQRHRRTAQYRELPDWI